MNRQFLQTWWVNHFLGHDVCLQEHHFVQKYLNTMLPENILSMGMDLGTFRLPEKCTWIRQNESLPADVLANSLALPWVAQSFDVVVVCHELDCVGQHWQLVLTQIEHILQPHGRLILTGFNPYSLWRLDWRHEVPDVRHALHLHDLKMWCAKHHWQIEQGQFLNYLPPIRSRKWIENLRFLEQAGNRWLPHIAAVYALILRKDVLNVRLSKQGQNVHFSIDESACAWARNG